MAISSLVAGLVAVNVVHRLEAVEVDQQDREGLIGALRLGEAAVEFLVEQAAIGDAGQRIVTGQRRCFDLSLDAALDLARQSSRPCMEDDGKADRGDDEGICDFVELPCLVRAGDGIEPVERIDRAQDQIDDERRPSRTEISRGPKLRRSAAARARGKGRLPWLCALIPG